MKKVSVNRATKMRRKYHIWVAKWFSCWRRVKDLKIFFIIFDLKCIIFEIFDISNSHLERSGDTNRGHVMHLQYHVTKLCNTMWSPRLTESNKVLELRSSSTLKPTSKYIYFLPKNGVHFYRWKIFDPNYRNEISFWFFNFRISKVNQQQSRVDSR